MAARVEIDRSAQWLLILFAFMLGTGYGAALFEMVIIVPAWSSSPAAARAWTVNPGPFFIVVSPLIAILAIAVVVAMRRVRADVRTWARVGAIGYLVVFVTTLAFYAPEQTALKGEPSLALSDAELTERTERWVTLNVLRQAIGTVAFAATLYGLSITYRSKGPHQEP